MRSLRRSPLLVAVLVGCGSNSGSFADGGVFELDARVSSPDGPATEGGTIRNDDASMGTDAPQGVADGGSADYDQVAPTPPAEWVNATGNLAGMSSECGNMGGVYPEPRADRLVAGVALQGLWASTDGAATWFALGTTGDAIKNRTTAIVFDPAHDGWFWESGIYGWETTTYGVFMTKNTGSSFQGYTGLSTAQMGGNTSDSVAVDFSDPQRKTLLAGTHEQKQTLYLSTDSGNAWSEIGSALPPGLGFCTTTMVLDAKTFLVGCAASWSGKAGAVLRSTDGGKSFNQVHAHGVVGQPLAASNGSIYWAAEGGGIDMSTDQGNTWQLVADANTAGTVRPLELPDGRIVSAQQKNIVVSGDHGRTWAVVGKPTPYVPIGLAYSPFRRAFYIWYITCSGSNAVPADGIMRFGWDYK